ncbi:hypothetical protein phiCTC2B_15 (endogenous virus) [Clostridium phage phiCTC2B]|uniref:hypothetical protein n=1 Tax=Clostridium phage phiCT19406B TaxID=1567010 RepID=UPI0002EED89A|nr:hypothetical protein [Clostridium tetani]YP_009276912.1 hypothetical protein phiCT19406B_15 [Clostridium phage phiCT19406B]YP_009277356.1 hypothetical protein phiCTC2B_15 [Clostridium phage phiCTC2B]AJA42772.1 hypothetical protein phiCT19406B_15 [Clostridium phage phiCT19406B]AJA42968.1 hypothetical protein phiCTC2B_15 [Clostridium phage phiCTC2B]KGI39130.1 hypothetical protein KY52_04905 [Clostridium tetani]KGI41938.1 hypothetical protein KY54_14025 [Clostridium tetani]KHO31336.1 hypothe
MLTTLLITNITITVAVGIMVLKEIDKLKKDIEHTELSITVQIGKDAEKLGYDIADIKKELKEELKEHISKEFMAMTFRGIRIFK